MLVLWSQYGRLPAALRSRGPRVRIIAVLAELQESAAATSGGCGGILDGVTAAGQHQPATPASNPLASSPPQHGCWCAPAGLLEACSRRIGSPMIPPLYEPQLAVAGAPGGPLAGWAAEPKLDGYPNSPYQRQ